MKRGAEWEFKNAKSMDYSSDTKFSMRKTVISHETFGWRTGEYVAQFQTTIALTKNGTVRLSGPAALDTSKVKSEKKLEDEELLKLIAEPLKAGKSKNKKKKKASGEEKGDEEEEEK
jgi:hypothetical protein